MKNSLMIVLAALNFTLSAQTTEETTAQKTPKPTTSAQSSESVDTAPVLLMAEVPPQYEGGEGELFKFIANTMKYPQAASDQNIEGIVYVNFVVNRDGRLSDVKVRSSSLFQLSRKKNFSQLEKTPVKENEDLYKEALRIVTTMPAWKPATQASTPVRVAYTIPVKFKLQ